MTQTPAPRDPIHPDGPPPPPVSEDPPPPPTVPEGTAGPSAPDRAAPGTTRRSDALERTRTSGAWAGVIVAAVLLVLLIVFIAQNTASTDIRFLWFDGSLPLAAALLLATVVGMAVAGAIGSLRILQLRRRIKRERKG